MEKHTYKKFKMGEIHPKVRDLAVSWVENFKPYGGIMIEQKHKLAMDIMNVVLEMSSEVPYPNALTDLLIDDRDPDLLINDYTLEELIKKYEGNKKLIEKLPYHD